MIIKKFEGYYSNKKKVILNEIENRIIGNMVGAKKVPFFVGSDYAAFPIREGDIISEINEVGNFISYKVFRIINDEKSPIIYTERINNVPKCMAIALSEKKRNPLQFYFRKRKDNCNILFLTEKGELITSLKIIGGLEEALKKIRFSRISKNFIIYENRKPVFANNTEEIGNNEEYLIEILKNRRTHE